MPLKLLIVLLTLTTFCHNSLADSVNRYSLICKEAVKIKENNDAISSCLRQLEAAKSSEQNVKDIVDIQLELAALYGLKGDKAQSNYYLAQVKKSQHYAESTNIQYRWLRLVGLGLLHDTNFKSAQKYLQDAYNLANAENDQDKLAKSSNDLGLIYYKQSDYKNALLFYKESLKLKEGIGNDYYTGTTLNNLGLINKDLKNYKLALQYYEQALDHFLSHTEQENFDHRVFNNISHLYEDLAITNNLAGNREKGDRYVEKIINTFSNKIASNDKVRALKNLAMVHIAEEEPERAKVFIDQTMRFSDSSNKYLDEIHYVNAYIAFLNQDYSLANEIAQKAVETSVQLNKNKTLENTYQLLYKTALAQKNYSQAINYQTQYYQYKELGQKAQYQTDLKVIEEQIERERVERRLVTEQLKTQQQQNKIKSLSNIVLIVLLILVILIVTTAFIIYRKAKEKQNLLHSIKTHKEKLLLIESDNEHHSDTDVTGSESFTSELQEVDFRQLLVDLLVDTIAAWEKASQKDRIELSDKSGIWKVSIDDGRLRTRSLDKYMDINKIPQNPRWRNVVKTSHYVLAECQLSSSDRNQLEHKLDRVMSEIKAQSLGQSL